MKKLEEFITATEAKARVQAMVPERLYERVNKVREKKDLTWHELMEALFKRVVAENE